MATPPIENLIIRSQEDSPISEQGRETGSEEAKGQLEEAKGRLEEVKGQLEEVKGQLEETKRQLEEVKRQLEEVKRQLEAANDMVGRQKFQISSHEDDGHRLRGSRDKYLKAYRSTKEQLEQSEEENRDLHEAHEEALRKRDRRIQAVEDDLARTKELLAARSTELSGAQSFLSTTDKLSEADVLNIVRDLNENIFQVASNLTEEWERLEPSRSVEFKPTKKDIDGISSFYGPTLTHQVIEREPTAVTFLVQSCLCHFATEITTSWRHDRDTSEYKVLGSVYKRLSAFEGQPVSAGWRSLTHGNLPEPVSHSASLTQFVAEVLWLTGTFSSNRSSLDFVTAKASKGIATIDRLAARLESVFMVEIASSDMNLLEAHPHAEFDDAMMSLEFESDVSTASGRGDKVAGTIEVGVEKSVGKRGEGLRTKVLLKAKVILDRDLSAS